MTEELDFLIKYLLSNEKRIKPIKQLPQSSEEKFYLFKYLCNIRETYPISKEYTEKEKIYLQYLLSKSKVTDINDIKPISKQFPKNKLKNSNLMCIWQGDITKLKIDAVVNAANSGGLGCFQPSHNCIDNQLHTYAGIELRNECEIEMKKIGRELNNGEAFITNAYNLPCKKIIHTVGPCIESRDYPNKNEQIELANCYINSLKLAMDNNCRNVSFPCISTGLFSFPKDLASKIALNSVDEFLSKNENKFDKIVFNLWNDEDIEVYKRNIL